MSHYPDTKRAEAIKKLYIELLNRKADDPGLEFYYNSDISLANIRAILETSDERKKIVRKKAAGGLDMDFIEPWLLCGLSPDKESTDSLQSLGVKSVLYLGDSLSFEPHFLDAFLHVDIPSSSVLSVSNLEESLKFIKSSKSFGKLLVCCDTGDCLSPAIIWLWYIAEGLDDDAAKNLVMSKRSSASIDNAMIGPWHLSCASKIFK